MSLGAELNVQVRRPSTPGANQWIIYNSSGVDGANANLLFNVAVMTLNVGGNINAAQNLSTGNLSVTQNTTTGNLVVSTLANTISLNVSANISNTGNLLVTQNTFTGNLSVTTLANIATLNVSVNANVAALNVGGLANLITLNVSSNANVSYLNVQNLINTSTLNVSVNANVAALNVSGLANISGTLNVVANINCSQNISVGNVSVTQNIITGNLIIQTRANVVTLNANGVITANATPLINTEIRVATGLTCNLTANAQTNNNTAQTNVLSVTFNEAGMYRVDALILYGTTVALSNAGNVGLNIAFGNSGTASIATIKYAAQGRANGNTIISNLVTGVAQSAIVAVSGASQIGSIAPSTSATDYVVLTGYLNVSAVGTLNIQVASANSLNANVNVMANSYVVYTKIG